MDPPRLLHYVLFCFLSLLTATLAYRALTGKLALSGLLSAKLNGNAVSPERVQLLIATLAISTHYLLNVVHGSGRVVPDVSRSVLVLFGSSSGVYAAVKAVKFRAGNGDSPRGDVR